MSRRRSLAHPFGVRGVGEPNIVPPPAAITNSSYRATGLLHPETIMEAIWSRKD